MKNIIKNLIQVWNQWISGEEPGQIRAIGGTKAGSSISNIDDKFQTLWSSLRPSMSRNQFNIYSFQAQLFSSLC